MALLLIGPALTVAQTRYSTGLDPTAEQFKKAARVETPPAAVVESGGVTALAPRVDLTAAFPAPGDQGPIGACGPWAVGYAARSFLEAAQRGWSLSDRNNLFSPSFLYNIVADGRDQGSSFPELFTVMMTRGAATFATMPYTTDLTRRPTDAAFEEARNFRIRSYYRIEPGNVTAIKSSLAEGRPVVFGMNVNQAFMDYRGGVFRATTGRNLGGHAMALVGYDDSRGAFRVLNSWGTRWGEGGYAWVAYQTFSALTEDVWALEALAAAAPQSIPVPVDVVAGEGESTRHVEVSWAVADASATANVRYRVFRANPQNQRFEAVGETTDLAYRDADALPGVRYLYAVASALGESEGEKSRVAVGWRAEPREAPGVVRGLEGAYLPAAGGRAARVELRWSALEAVDFYEVLRRGPDGYFYTIGASADTLFTDTPSAGTRSYDYIVRAVNQYGTGQLSYPVTVLIRAAAAEPERTPAAPSAARATDDRTVRGTQQVRVPVERTQMNLFDPAEINRYFQEARRAEEEAFRRYRGEQQQQFDARRSSEQDAFQQFLRDQRGGR